MDKVVNMNLFLMKIYKIEKRLDINEIDFPKKNKTSEKKFKFMLSQATFCNGVSLR